MIPLFPAGYPEEIFYNICARFVARAHYPTGVTAIQDLFGTRTGAIVDIPSYLGHFVDALPMDDGCKLFTVDSIIDDHSLLPFYGPFLTPERLERERAYMDGRDLTGAPKRRSLGFKLLRSPRRLRYCPTCARDDRKTYGECYWHRVHQIAGVVVCPVHGCPLNESAVLAHTMGTYYNFTAAEDAVLQGVEPRHREWSERSQDALLKIALDAAWLLKQRHLVIGPAAMSKRYIHVLADSGMTRSGMRINVDKFLEVFTAYYPSDIAALLGIPLRNLRYGDWPLVLLRDERQSVHPVHHLMVMHALGCRAEDFCALPVERAPFGVAPWPCLNPAGDHQGDLCVDHCAVRIVKGYPVGTFRCTCGFTYVRHGPDVSEEDRRRYDVVESYGPAWDAALERRWHDMTIPISKVPVGLDVSRRTAEREAIRLGLTYPRADSQSRWALGSSSGWHVMSEDERRENYRGRWRQAMADNPDAGMTQLRWKLYRVCEWLSRNDAEWFEANRPAKHSPTHSTAATTRVDWLARDRILAEKVEHVARRLCDAPGRPVRFTVQRIADTIDQQNNFNRERDRLLQTWQVLTDVVETHEEFWGRLIHWAVQSFLQEGTTPLRTHVARRSGLRSKYGKEGRLVGMLIDEALGSLKSNVPDHDAG